MGTQSIANLIKELRKDSSTVLVRESIPFSWATDIGQAGQLLEAIFRAVDSAIDIYHSLPEYFEIKHWMLNTEGKGLLMMGNSFYSHRVSQVILQTFDFPRVD